MTKFLWLDNKTQADYKLFFKKETFEMIKIWEHRRLVVDELLSDDVVCKPRNLSTEKEEYLRTWIGSIYEKYIKILNVYSRYTKYLHII